MAERLAYLEAVIGADITQFRKAMRDVRNDVGVLSETIGGLGKLGRTATFAISAPLATLGSFAVQAASDFDASMRNINSIAGLSEQQFNDLSDSVLAFSTTTRGGAVESANSLYTVFSAGITGTSEAMQIMEIATKTAEAGLADMETTTESLVASILGFGEANMSATRASDALTQMVQIGVGSMQQFAGATAKVTPSAAALGIEIEELYASLAFLTQRGVNAAVASTQIRSAFTALQKPTEAMEAAFRSLGVNGAEDLIQQFGGMEGAFKALIRQTDGTSGAIAKLFSNTRAKDFVMQIANNMDIYGKAMDDFEEGVEGATDRAHIEQMKSFSAQWDLMTSGMEAAAISVGEVLLPVLLPLVHGITDIFSAVTQLNPEILQMGVAFAGVLTIAPPLLWLFATLLNPIGLLIAGITALGSAFVNNLGGISKAISSLVSSIPALDSLANTFENLFGSPPTAEELIGGDAVSIAVEDLIQVTAPDGKYVWDYWLERTDQSITWTEFKAMWIANNGTLDIQAGQLVTINETDLSETVGEGMANSIIGADQIFLDEIARREKLQIEADELIAINNPQGIAMGLGMKLGIAFEALKSKIPVILGSVVESMRAWFDEKVGLGLTWIGSLFSGTADTGGRTGLYRAIQKLMEGDFVSALNSLSDGLGDKVSDFFGGVFEFDTAEVFPKISVALGTLFTNVGEWLVNDAIPTVAKSIGFLIGSIGNLLFKGFQVLANFFTGGGANDVATGIGEFVDEKVATPFTEGFDDALIGSDLGDAFGGVVEGVETELDTISTSLSTGFDTFATDVSTSVNAAITTVTTTIDDISYQIEKALQPVLEVMDSLGLTQAASSMGILISDFFGDVFDDSTPMSIEKIGTALGTLMTGVGDWLITDGVPALSKTIGFFAGKVASLFFSGFKMIGDFLFGSGGDAGDAIGDVASFAGDAIFDPLREGFDEGVEGSEFASAFGDMKTQLGDAITAMATDAETSLTTFGTTISTHIDTAKALIQTALDAIALAFDVLEFDVLVSGFEDLAVGVVDFATDLANADWSGVIKIGGALVTLFNVVGGTFLSVAGEALDVFGDSIADFLDGISALMNGDGDAFSLLIAGFIDLAFALATFPIAIIDTLMTAIGDLLGLDLSHFGEAMQSLKDFIDGLVFEDPNIEVGSFEWSLGAGHDESVREMLTGFDESIMTALSDIQIENDLDLSRMQIVMKGVDWVVAGTAPEDALGALLAEYDWFVKDDMLVQLQTLLFSIENGTIEPDDPEGLQTAVDGAMDADGVVVDVPAVAPTLFDDEAIATAATQAGVSATEALSSTMKDEFLNGDMSPEQFQETFLTPFNDNWLASFGTEGVVQTALVATGTQFGTTMAGITASSMVTSVLTGIAMNTLATSIENAMTRVSDTVKEAKGNVDSFLEAIQTLASVMTDLKVKVEVTGSVNAPAPDGVHRTGLDTVPFDGYLAELHKGERVLTRSESKMWDGSSIPSTVTGVGGGGNTTNNNATQNTVVIDGSVGVDALLEELERRGIYLE